MVRNWLIAAVAIVGLGFLGATGARADSIVNSDHDLSTRTATTDQVCIFCHTPHNTAAPSTLPVPLWNRQASTVTFTMYDSPSIDMTIAASPEGVSAACLSCHDGATAFDALIFNPGVTLPDTITGSAAVGAAGDLTNDHPISITYSVGTGAGQDPNFVSPISGKVGTLPLFRAPGATGDGTQVECGTCHNVHDPANEPFLRIANTGSALCTTCHTQ